MPKYTVTVFEKDGSKLLEETFEASDDKQARSQGEKFLAEKNVAAHTSRVTSPTGKLVHFHR